MRSNRREELNHWRKGLLRSIKRDIREVLGPRPAHIRKYYTDYRRVFRRSVYRRVGREEMMRAVRSASLVYLGDFHTLKRSQESHREILEALLVAGKKPVLAMEMFASDDQDHIDRYIRGELEDPELLKNIKYEQSWGFRWNHYRGILTFARENGLRVYGINAKRNISLVHRDQHFAEIIAGCFPLPEDSPLVVIVGDLHCSPSHLPARVESLLGRKKRSVTIYQNSETIFLREMERGRKETLEVVRISKNSYCVFNTPPWVKMETYLNWLNNSEELLGRELGRFRDEAGYMLDYDNQLSVLVKRLAKFFGVFAVDPEEIHLAAVDDFDFLLSLLNVPHAHPFFHMIQDRQAFFVPGENILYLPSLDINCAAAEITRLLLSRHQGYQEGHVYQAGSFFRRVLYLAAGYFAARVVNPMYPLETPEETGRKLEGEGDRKSARKLSMIRKGNRLGCLFWEYLLGAYDRRAPYDSAEANRRDAELCYRASILLGKWTALRMVRAHEEGNLPVENIRERFPAPADNERDALQSLRYFVNLRA